MDVKVLDDYEVRAVDSLNWQVYQHKEVKGRDGARVEWVALPAFFRDLESAIDWIAKRVPKADRKGRSDLDGFLAEYRAVCGEIARHARRFEKVVRGVER